MFKNNVKNTPQKYKRHFGFTIVELIVVITVIGILASITLISYNGWRNTTIANQLKSDLNGVAAAMENARNFGNGYPATVPTTFKPSSGVTLNGGSLNGGASYCIDATNGLQSYFISPKYSRPLIGACPILYLDAAISASYSGTGTKWSDLSGNDYDSILSGGVAYNSSNGGVMNFDGVNGRIASPNNIGLGTQELTVSTWIKQQSYSIAGSSRPYVSDWNSWSPGSQKGFVLREYNAETAPSFWLADGTNYFKVASSQPVSLNVWYNVVGVFKAGSIFKIYINGVEKGSSAAPTQYVEETTTPVYIGYGTVNTGYFAGQIGNVKIYNKALSVDEINESFNAIRSHFGV